MTPCEHRRIAQQAARDLERAARYLASGKALEALTVLQVAAREARRDLKASGKCVRS